MEIGRFLIVAGIVLAIVGLAWPYLGRLGLGRQHDPFTPRIRRRFADNPAAIMHRHDGARRRPPRKRRR